MSDLLIRENQELASYNTMGIAVRARYFTEIKSIAEFRELTRDSRYREAQKLMLGGGSNILFLNDYDGFVIRNQIKGKEILRQHEDGILLKVGGGENWHELVLHCVQRNWGGIENLALIPGLAGAAPIQNIGAYGVELEQVFEELQAIHIQTGALRVFKKDECGFGYRNSIFKGPEKGKYFIASVTLRLQENPPVNTNYKALADYLNQKSITHPTIKDVCNAVIKIRQSKLPDPAKIGNAGSFFKNPVISQQQYNRIGKKYPQMPAYKSGDEYKIPAAWLIEHCGWKGRRVGDAGVHTLQALVIVNYGKATGAEIWELAQGIQQSVKEKFGIALVPEVNVI